jgi:hypothetical protein
MQNDTVLMSKNIKIALWTLVIVLLGFLRGYLFGNINWIYKTLTENRPNGARLEFHFLLDWSTANILILKWILTMLFFGVFALLTWLIVKIIFQRKDYNKVTLLVFGSLLAVAAVLYLFYFLLGNPIEIYAIIRTIMGIGQSFMPLMLLVIAFKFVPTTRNNDINVKFE